MIVGYFLRGWLIGIVFGVPAGAIGALTIQRALQKGFSAGLITGMGSSAADLLYSCVSVFGLTMISDFLLANQTVIRMVGGILIVLLGVATLGRKGAHIALKDTKGRPIIYFLSAFSAAMLNPATILSFMVAFSAFGLGENFTFAQGIVLIAGIFAGTLCWWTALSGIVAHFRKRVTDHIYQWLNRILGCLMMLFGAFMLVQVFLQ